MDVDELKRLFETSGKTQKGLADRLKVDPGVISRMLKGKREIKAREIPLIRAYFEGQQRSTEEFAPNVALGTQREGALPSIRLSDVPVFGTTSAGKDGDFSFNGQVIEYVPRGPGIMTKRAVYALYVQGDSMSPWKESGEKIYVDPNLPVRNGDYVVVEIRQTSGEETPLAYVKKLVGRTPSKIKLRQFNPAAEIEFPLDRLVRCHRVLKPDEVLGS